MHPYRNFILMIVVSATLMFCLMYLNTYQPSHVRFSQTRLFMTFIMAGSMALVMLFFMRHMYRNAAANVAIVVASLGLMGLGVWLVRSQATVDDVAWMRAMIPHHSIAILTSERAGIDDPRVRRLADDIIEAQRREIGEMEQLIRELADQPPMPAAAHAGSAAASIVHDYRCASGESVVATYPSTDAATVQYKGRTYAMKVVMSGSGARYAGGGLEWWTKGSGPGSEGSLSSHGADGTSGTRLETCTAS